MRFCILVAALACLMPRARAAADLDLNTSARSFYVVTVTTSAPYRVLLPRTAVTIVHLGLQSDGSTASAATDKLFGMKGAATMDATTADGEKIQLVPQGTCTISGVNLPSTTNGAREMQLQASGHACKVLILTGGQ